MGYLTPSQAAQAAIGVYGLEEGTISPELAFAKKDFTEINQRFTFKGTSTMFSKTGAFIKFRSGFGIIARGSDQKESEALLAIRGTSSAADWLSDFNIGLQVSGTGKVIHAGFNRVYNEFGQIIINYLRQHKVDTLHCVGHSLGGALASLAADSVRYNSLVNKVNLYTFGSPRVGFSGFAERLTTNVGKENIFRVHHSTDIVTFVPEWPYTHVPVPGDSYCIPGSGFNPISAHFKDNYNYTVGKLKAQDWSSLPGVYGKASSEDEVKNWLVSGFNALSSFTLNMIGKAIQLIIRVANIIIIPGMTGLDILSYALSKAATATKEALSLTKLLMKKILRMLGHVVSETAKLTAEFIRYVFNLLARAIYSTVDTALRLLNI